MLYLIIFFNVGNDPYSIPRILRSRRMLSYEKISKVIQYLISQDINGGNVEFIH